MLLSNFNRRKRDFGLMMAAGFSVNSIRKILFAEQALILLAGTFTGFVSALVATRPSMVQNSDVPWKTILIMILLIIVDGISGTGSCCKKHQKGGSDSTDKKGIIEGSITFYRQQTGCTGF